MDLNTYLFFDGDCEAAFKLYEQALGGRIAMLMRYSDAPDGPPGFKDSQRVLHVSLDIGGRMLMGSDAPPPGVDVSCGGEQQSRHERPQGFRANVSVDTPADAERIFALLSDGGKVEQPLAETFFSQRFGMATDRFGTPWMVNCSKGQEAHAEKAAPAETAHQTTQQARPFAMTRTFSAPRQEVWAAFTEPARLEKWWGPKGVEVFASTVELKPGGMHHYGLRMPDGKELWGRQVYREIVRPERIVLMSSFSDEKGGLARHPLAPTWPIALHTTLTFREVSQAASMLTVVWTPQDASAEELAAFDAGHGSMTQGWSETLDKLDAYLTRVK